MVEYVSNKLIFINNETKEQFPHVNLKAACRRGSPRFHRPSRRKRACSIATITASPVDRKAKRQEGIVQGPREEEESWSGPLAQPGGSEIGHHSIPSSGELLVVDEPVQHQVWKSTKMTSTGSRESLEMPPESRKRNFSSIAGFRNGFLV
ncbi:hypothetical protein SELMODRAFT_402511 [Selaginella moellendorffii]|uniref:Uncharacterized protein n=1 Tax=Selaginella moellendorffii TaxID=88036 RepID=D8QQW5_SELML|nr:hypothetical protein SELMODRAFT_402511 [Selaginella moellendorffii]